MPPCPPLVGTGALSATVGNVSRCTDTSSSLILLYVNTHTNTEPLMGDLRLPRGLGFTTPVTKSFFQTNPFRMAQSRRLSPHGTSDDPLQRRPPGGLDTPVFKAARPSGSSSRRGVSETLPPRGQSGPFRPHRDIFSARKS